MYQKQFYFFVFFFIFTSAIFCQNFSKHLVVKGETVLKIATKYKITPYAIYQLNRDAQNGIKENDLLLLPITAQTGTLLPPQNVIHGGNKTGNSSLVVVKTTSTKTKNTVDHVVLPQETKYGIAKKYGITLQELEKRNPEITESLPIGFHLNISGKTSEKLHTNEVLPPTLQKRKTTYEVHPKETIFSICHDLSINEADLLALNPEIKMGLKTGMNLNVPDEKPVLKPVMELKEKRVEVLKKSNFSKKQHLVLLLPFNASRIQEDTLKTVAVRLKKDAFLNMTLDFYSGALMAIDSAKALGLNVDVSIYDSEESKASSNVTALLMHNDLDSASAIIGPFYQQYVEKVAAFLMDKKIPIISPLSKEIGKSYSNLYQSMPSNDFAKNAIFDFMKSKNGNTIVVSDPKKISNNSFIIKKAPESKFVTFTATGALDLANFKSVLDSDKLNYVVLDSEKTSVILQATKFLISQIPNFKIQLVIIEPNQTLDFEEIPLSQLTALHLLYPSLTRENVSPEAQLFESKYKEKNKIFPNAFAIRGFDITFDTLLRLSQGKSFENSASDDTTQQIENKFEYSKNDNKGFVNKGIYILQYESDLSVNQVN